MKNLVKAVVFSVSSTLVATSAFAAPQEHHSPYNQPQKSHVQQAHKTPVSQHHAQQYKQDHKHPAQAHTYKQLNKKVDPSRDWRVGQKVPAQYQSKAYKVDHSKYKKLSKPGRNQQWLKVNGDYVLSNLINDRIVKIIAG